MNPTLDIDQLSHLFINKFGVEPGTIVKLPGAGSGRRYYSMCGPDGARCIGVAGENQADCRAFIALSRIFSRYGIPVPEIYDVSEDGMYYIEQDLGDRCLLDIIKEGDPAATEKYLRLSISNLLSMQAVPVEEWKESVEYNEFGRRQIMWDLNYFKYEYLKLSKAIYNEERLEDDFERLADDLVESGKETEGFMFRDFQSRNIHIKNDNVWFIDYQGGRKGPGVYDLISLLWQAKADFNPELRKQMIVYYAALKSDGNEEIASEIKKAAPLYALFRTLQVLGAYGLRGLVEKKAHFIESIPGALKNLDQLLCEGVLDAYPELRDIASQLVKDPRFIAAQESADRLRIKVFSFSYKKGYPEDLSGNGGGFMFDCRGMHNPGRYDEYKPLTGMDIPVIEFLEEKGEVQKFVANAMDLVMPTIDRYIKRGFTGLQIGFGCTGGRHRSVYCAESLSLLLKERFPEAEVNLIHREQGIERII